MGAYGCGYDELYLQSTTFTQHHVDSLDMFQSTVLYMAEMFNGQKTDAHGADALYTEMDRCKLLVELAIKPTLILSYGQYFQFGVASNVSSAIR
ncbi:uncharacterized protein PHALS_01188 [Plasmopara halstedii]|uniref:Uncharacterized protein n=1 Tax=Plasmopara halstedii TaxID=4781 RepID=A0A0P1AW46_PLAHL|nr:uncharacterized protein PHALS_01188 [Plasmopara halstedii]CEG44856.1 hypothetical protein PHALS_01188 [Plasmopara halstedii]|eukprot:XP_024581225.1 hypothetical protein PHALS_01188 [Plasmopara halstedii]